MLQPVNVWDNPENYKPCVKKLYDVYVCKPPIGTVVVNKLEQNDSYLLLNKQDYVSVSAMQKNPQLRSICQQLVANNRAYLVSDANTLVLSGTQGELWCISAAKFIQKYDAAKPSLLNYTTFDWMLARTKPNNSKALACFVPRAVRGKIATSYGVLLDINAPNVPHGKGDFVISTPDAYGRPTNERYVVNGAVFGATYNRHGWSNCLHTDMRYSLPKPSSILV